MSFDKCVQLPGPARFWALGYVATMNVNQVEGTPYGRWEEKEVIGKGKKTKGKKSKTERAIFEHILLNA